MAKNVLKAWPVDNTVTTDDKADKIFSLETTHSIDKGNHTGSHGGKESWRAVRDDGDYAVQGRWRRPAEDTPQHFPYHLHR